MGKTFAELIEEQFDAGKDRAIDLQNIYADYSENYAGMMQKLQDKYLEEYKKFQEMLSVSGRTENDAAHFSQVVLTTRESIAEFERELAQSWQEQLQTLHKAISDVEMKATERCAAAYQAYMKSAVGEGPPSE